MIALSVYIIRVYLLDHCAEPIKNIDAISCNVVSELDILVGAIMCMLFKVCIVFIKPVPERHLDEGRCSVVLPVGHAVSDHEAYQVEFEISFSSLSVVLINLPNDVWDVKPSV